MIKEEEIEYTGKKYENAGQVNFYIEKLENSVPDKRTKEYQSWKLNINFLIDIYNKFVNFKAMKKYD